MRGLLGEPCDLCPAGGLAGFEVVVTTEAGELGRMLCGDHLMPALEVLDLFHVEHVDRPL